MCLVTGNEEIFLLDFLVILTFLLQNYGQILKYVSWTVGHEKNIMPNNGGFFSKFGKVCNINSENFNDRKYTIIIIGNNIKCGGGNMIKRDR